MRKPTVIRDLYAWHRSALAGQKPMITHTPECGWFVRRLVKGGPIVPARIWLHQEIDEATGELVGDERMRCEVGRKERDPIEEWVWLADAPISEAEYNFRCADAVWCRTHAPGSPEANPSLPVASASIPPLF